MEHEHPPEHPGNSLHEFASILADLRWFLASLRMVGIAEFPYIEASHRTEAAQEELQDLPNTAREHHLADVFEDLGECTRCRLHTERGKLVFGEGNPEAPLVFVGEGPGFEEDRQGRPFVGKAGKLLDKMIAAIGFQREAVYICNVVKCRPPGNRTPSPDEITACSPFLFRQIEAIRPRVICALGACAAQTLMGNTSAISRLRGKVHSWRGLPLICTYHPAYLLRNPEQKAAAWRDLLLVQQLLETALEKAL